MGTKLGIGKGVEERFYDENKSHPICENGTLTKICCDPHRIENMTTGEKGCNGCHDIKGKGDMDARCKDFHANCRCTGVEPYPSFTDMLKGNFTYEYPAEKIETKNLGKSFENSEPKKDEKREEKEEEEEKEVETEN